MAGLASVAVAAPFIGTPTPVQAKVVDDVHDLEAFLKRCLGFRLKKNNSVHQGMMQFVHAVPNRKMDIYTEDDQIIRVVVWEPIIIHGIRTKNYTPGVVVGDWIGNISGRKLFQYSSWRFVRDQLVTLA
jgi:hypothetical protein